MRFEVGQILVFEVDPEQRRSLFTGWVIGSRWTHVVLVVRGGVAERAEILNSYPGTHAEILPLPKIQHRRWLLLDPHLTIRQKFALRKAAISMIGRRYWRSPCSRLVAQTFHRAGISILEGGPRNRRERSHWLLPRDYLTRMAFPVVSRKTN